MGKKLVEMAIAREGSDTAVLSHRRPCLLCLRGLGKSLVGRSGEGFRVHVRPPSHTERREAILS